MSRPQFPPKALPVRIARLRVARLQVWYAARDLANLAADQDRYFTDQEQRRWDELDLALNRFDGQIEMCLRQARMI